jgi:DNA-binding protein Fis
MAKTYKPTSGMASAARRALKWKSEGKPGGTLVGLARANQLKDRDPLSASVVLRMYSFFSRHEVDKKATGFYSGQEGFPSKGRVAWDLWGGDGGYSWSTAKRNQIMRERENKAIQLVRLAQKGMISKPLRMMAAQVLENYANENISEELEAFGQFMYHAELLRNDHLDIYLLDLHRVEQPYRDILVEVFSQLDDMHDEPNVVDDEDSDEDTPLSL